MIRLDDLCLNGLKIYQQTDGFCFGTDAVLLAWFAGEKKFSSGIDLCGGNGIIPLLLSVRPCCRKIVGVESDPEQADLARKSFEYNGLSDKLRSEQADLRQIYDDPRFSPGKADLVTVNPPYFSPESGKVSQGKKAQARSEISCTLDDVCKAAAYLLKNSGRLCMINRPERLTDIFSAMKNNGIEPKRTRFVCSRAGAAPVLVLAEGIKGGKSGVSVQPQVEITDSEGKYTRILNEIYGFDKNGGSE